MDDTLCENFFRQPSEALQRRYEASALSSASTVPCRRSPSSMATLSRQPPQPRDAVPQSMSLRPGSPLFTTPSVDGLPGSPAPEPPWLPETQPSPIAGNWTSPRDAACGLGSPGSSSSCPCWLASASTSIVQRAGYPGSRDGPRHRRPAEPAGPEVARQGTAQPHQRLQLRRGPRPLRRPQRPAQEATFATDYSYRTQRCHQQQLLSGWVSALAPLLFPQAEDLLAWTSTPSRSGAIPPPWTTTTCPCRGKAGPSVLSFFAQEPRAGSCAMPTPT